MIYQLYLSTQPDLAEKYLTRANKLVNDIIRECLTPQASLHSGKVEWGEGGWETILQVRPSVYWTDKIQHSTINGNHLATRRLMDHGLICTSQN